MLFQVINFKKKIFEIYTLKVILESIEIKQNINHIILSFSI